MGRKIALLSGGKDSLYAAYLEQPIDAGLLLVYESPTYPSPHLVNLGKTLETLLHTGTPILAAKLPPGKGFEYTVKTLRLLEADTLVAGDVFIEDHLEYYQKVAGEAGATLREPLWGQDTLELAWRIAEAGFESIVIGQDKNLPCSILGRTLDKNTLDNITSCLIEAGADPLGENGEYHTLVTNSPLHTAKLEYKISGQMEAGGHLILRLV